MALFDFPAGQRLAIIGHTGSGKTTLARRFLLRSPYHWFIFNPKGTAAYAKLPNRAILSGDFSEWKLRREIERHQYVLLNFGPTWTWADMDSMITYLCATYTNIGICIDELYTIHNSGRAGPGINGLITRGRELRQSFIGLTQRPAWVSTFVFSEADYLAEFRLNTVEDRKIVYRIVGNEVALTKRQGHDFVYFDVAADHATIYRADG